MHASITGYRRSAIEIGVIPEAAPRRNASSAASSEAVIAAGTSWGGNFTALRIAERTSDEEADGSVAERSLKRAATSAREAGSIDAATAVRRSIWTLRLRPQERTSGNAKGPVPRLQRSSAARPLVLHYRSGMSPRQRGALRRASPVYGNLLDFRGKPCDSGTGRYGTPIAAVHLETACGVCRWPL